MSRIIILTFLLTNCAIILEYVYTKYILKKNVYTKVALSNSVRGFIVELLSYKVLPVYFAICAYLFPTFISFSIPKFSIGTLISFILTLATVDLCWYLFHTFNHSFALPWRLHSVHHSDRTYTLTTAIRISWVEQLYLPVFFIPAIFISSNIYIYLTAFIYLNIHQFLCHSAVLRFPSIFSAIFVTPQSHKIHHDQNEKNQNLNFGGIFTIWDRLFGTYANEINFSTWKPGMKTYIEDRWFLVEYLSIKNYFKIYTK